MSLLTALKSGDHGLVETICASGASPNELEDGASPMHIVVGLHRSYAKQLTKILLQYGGDPNVEDEEGLTPVHVSVIRGNGSILHLLLRNGGDASKRDEEGRDAWDYALKYARRSCQRVLRECADDTTVHETDNDHDKYVSIFHKDIPLAEKDDSLLSNRSSELNRGFIRSSFGSTEASTRASPSILSPEDLLPEKSHPLVNAPHPQPPPRRSKSVKSSYTGQFPRSISFCTSDLPKQEYYSHRPMSLPTESKRRKNLFSAIRKSLSPSSKTKSSHPRSQHHSPVTEPKSQSPLASLLKPSSKYSPGARGTSSFSSGNVRFDVGDSPMYHRSQSVSCNRTESDENSLYYDRPAYIDATSPDHCIISTERVFSSRKCLDLGTTGNAASKYSPSNYSQTVVKPEKEKRLGSPFEQKHRRKSSKSLFKRLVGSSSPSCSADTGALNLGVGQTIRLSEWNPNDSVSQLSLDVTAPSRLPPEGQRTPSSSHTTVINSKEMAAIEAGRKVFDVTSPDHCKVVEVDRTLSSPLERTVVYESPPPKPQRLFLKDSPSEGSLRGDSRPGLSSDEHNSINMADSLRNSAGTGVLQKAGPSNPQRYSATTSASTSSELVTTSRERVMELRGSLTAELEHKFKTMQMPLTSPETNESVPNGSSLNHRWSGKGKGKLVRQRGTEPILAADTDVRVVLSDEPGFQGDHVDGVSKLQDDNSYSRPLVEEQNRQLSVSHSPKSVRILTDDSREIVTDQSAPRVSVSKDSGIESAVTSQVRGQMRVSESEDSFHTCQSGQPLTESVELSSLLPTEMDSLQSKVLRMNLDEFTPIHSDNDSHSTGDLSQSKYVTVMPASICASDGSIAEYLHTDLDTNVTLTEARWPITCAATNHSRHSIDWKTFSELSVCSTISASEPPVVVPRDIHDLSDTCLLRELRDLGDVPGPITTSTRRIYQLRLLKLRNNPHLCTPNKLSGFSRELQQYMACHSSVSLVEINQLEQEMINQFDAGSGRKWREGNSKMSFTYLLLDPRTTKNLPARHHLLDSDENGEAFRVFISSVFYVGKGKKTRPYQHFIDAIRNKNTSNKTKQIVDIWKSGLGVVSLHLFHNILAVEAYTREACMVDAIGLKNLTNVAKCNYYGVASTWNSRKKRLVGADLLHKAYSILLVEGERQIRPADIRDESELPSFLV